eukprot:CAMPEP_0174724232 /NCGR_PEP_ID=MMETSP1094-20130205/42883_1 /TAXON_ID=156173 /ORGANISM="Chrysochromulina brevifilum, Strain UTEX LB 985" /LENGTH=580 /DNA_ID=CAMNT_0015925421 /DNA_START=45 /DNA_END=1787 /DNA_ORIENTATION=+
MMLPMPNEDETTQTPSDGATNRSSGGLLVKRPWTQDEDIALTAAVQKYGAARWSMIATQLSTGRVGKQCRERWSNHLCPEVKKSEWSVEEDAAIMHGVAALGTRWCEIIKVPELSGRTDNSIKNRFYALQRKVRAKQVNMEKADAPEKEPSDPEEPLVAPVKKMGVSTREQIVTVCREVVFSTDETERVRLIERLAMLCKSYATPSDSSTADFDLGKNMQSLSDQEILELLSSPSPAKLHSSEKNNHASDNNGFSNSKNDHSSETCQSSLSLGCDGKGISDDESSADLADDSSTASTVSPVETNGASAHKRAEWVLPELSEVDQLYNALELEARGGIEDQLGCDNRPIQTLSRVLANATSCDGEQSEPSPQAGKAAAMDTTAGCLGGRLAYKASLSPLCLPLDDMAEIESPKRMRTTADGGSAVPQHSRRPTHLSPSTLSQSVGCSPSAFSPSPLARSPSASSVVSDASTALEIAHGLSPRHAVTGTKGPGAAQEVAPLFAVTGTEEPGTVGDAAVAPCDASSTPYCKTTTAFISGEVDYISLSTFSNLFGDEIDIGHLSSPLISGGKRKDRAACWRTEP